MTTATTPFDTEQEAFWAGQFGNDYVTRNEVSPEILAGNLFSFARMLERAQPSPGSLIELGANIGLNLRALKLLLPHAHQAAVEINASAVERLRRDRVAHEVFHESLLNFVPVRRYDLALIKGMMNHLAPEMRPAVYRKLAVCATHHVLIAECHNRRAEEIVCRGYTGKLFRRDFGGEFMDACPEFQLMDYGFSYHRDARERQDDLTWFLFQRRT
jgi:spore coat polysaccharide biosynthesis protein SpsF